VSFAPSARLHGPGQSIHRSVFDTAGTTVSGMQAPPCCDFHGTAGCEATMKREKHRFRRAMETTRRTNTFCCGHPSWYGVENQWVVGELGIACWSQFHNDCPRCASPGRLEQRHSKSEEPLARPPRHNQGPVSCSTLLELPLCCGLHSSIPSGLLRRCFPLHALLVGVEAVA